MIDQVPKKEFSGTTWDQPKIGLRFKEFPSFFPYLLAYLMLFFRDYRTTFLVKGSEYKRNNHYF